MAQRFKPLYQVYNFFKKSELAYNEILYKKYNIPKKYFSSISSQDLKHLPYIPLHFDEHNTETELPKNKFFNSLPENYKQSLVQWSENGFAVLPQFFKSETEKVNTIVDDLLKMKKVKFKYGTRVHFAYKKNEYLKQLGENELLNKILEMLMGEELSLFSSLNFIEASQQRAHSDLIHMTTYPHSRLIAVWIALEDVDEENGALFYYPGSHKLAPVYNEDFDNVGSKYWLGKKDYPEYEDKIEEIVNEKKLERKIFRAKKGDLLIWHGNLIHGGLPLIDKNRTRKAMVFHYYANEAICFHEISQRPSFKKKSI